MNKHSVKLMAMNGRTIFIYMFCVLLCSLCLWLFHSHIGIRDLDAFCYIRGAQFIQQGQGYLDIDGKPIGTWPPAYSTLLSSFSEPITGAMAINYLSYGVVLLCLFLLGRRNGWNNRVLLCFLAVMGLGFFRGIATNAKPDLLAYSLFFAGVLIYLNKSRWSWLCFLIWNLIIPLKLIAVVFTPAALITNYFGRKNNSPVYWKGTVVFGVFSWLLCVGAVLTFNLVVTGKFIHGTPPNSLFENLWQGIWAASVSIPRSFLAYWYGPLRSTIVIALFLSVIACALFSLSSLRKDPRGRICSHLGLMIILLTVCLQMFQPFILDLRLLGYGGLLVIFSFRPEETKVRRWLVYATLSLVLALSNVTLVNSAGANYPPYKKLAMDLSQIVLPEGSLYTNSYHIMDVHNLRQSVPVETPNSLKGGSHFLWVTLPSYDGVAKLVWPFPPPEDGKWTQLAKLEGASLWIVNHR